MVELILPHFQCSQIVKQNVNTICLPWSRDKDWRPEIMKTATATHRFRLYNRFVSDQVWDPRERLLSNTEKVSSKCKNICNWISTGLVAKIHLQGKKILQENFATAISSSMKRVYAQISEPARQKSLALHQLVRKRILCLSTCTIIIQIISLLTNISGVFIMK